MRHMSSSAVKVKLSARPLTTVVSLYVGCLAAILFTGAYSTQALGDDQTANTYAKLKPSLALIVTQVGKNVITGTAFCVASNSSHSYFVTNRHVVAGQTQVSVIVQYPYKRLLDGTVLRVGEGALDAAVIQVDEPNIPAVEMSGTDPREGQTIAIAGYPATQLDLAAAGLGLSPAIHSGEVNALPGDGFFIEYDAQTEHGNSGGPLFDPADGMVYGIVSFKINATDQSNLGIAVNQARAFLVNAGVNGNYFSANVATTVTPFDSPTPTISVDPAACQQAVAQFNLAYNSYFQGLRVLFGYVTTASEATKNLNPHDSAGVAQALSASQDEYNAITNVMKFDEPKFDDALNQLSRDAPTSTAEAARDYISEVKRFDYFTQQLTSSYVSQYQTELTTGVAPPPDSASFTYFTQAGNALQEKDKVIRNLKPCP
jgi:V8-like Glu-specific endopeptidase